MHVSMPYGPHKITKVRQVAIPAELLHAVGLEVGDFIHYRLSDHSQGRSPCSASRQPPTANPPPAAAAELTTIVM